MGPKGPDTPPGASPPTYDPDFAQVLKAAQAGSGQAFEQIFGALNRRLLAFGRVRRTHDPEGFVNEVLLQVFTNIGTFRGSEPQFNGWVFTIARHKLIDEGRRRQRRPHEVSDDGMFSMNIAAVSNTEAEAIAKVGEEDLVARLDILTDEQRDVVLLRILGDLTVDSIAQVLGKKPGAIKALQRRAFRTLARELGADSPYPYDSL